MITRDIIIRTLTTWMERRLTGKRATRESVVLFLAALSPEERQGIWKLRTFYGRYNRGRKTQKPRGACGYGPRLEAWQQPPL